MAAAQAARGHVTQQAFEGRPGGQLRRPNRVGHVEIIALPAAFRERVIGGRPLVLAIANPLEDIRNTNTISLVMKNGRLYDGNTLDEVWPNKRKLPTFAWQNGAPAVNAGGVR